MGEDKSAWVEENNVINIVNNSNVDVSVGIEFTPASGFDNISGEFYSNGSIVDKNINMAVDESRSITVKLNGTIPSNTADKTKGGKVTVTVSLLK